MTSPKMWSVSVALMVSCLAIATEAAADLGVVRLQTVIKHGLATTYLTVNVTKESAEREQVSFQVSVPRAARLSYLAGHAETGNMTGRVTESQADVDKQRLQEENSVLGFRVKDQARLSVTFQTNISALVSLEYELLLQRSRGMYRSALRFSTGHPVNSIEIEYWIEDFRPLTFVRMAPPAEPQPEAGGKTNLDLSDQTAIDRRSNYATISYREALYNSSGISARAAVEFDVLHSPGGDILAEGDNFVHFVTAEGLGETLAKQAVFVLAMSGSEEIWYEKMKEGIEKILRLPSLNLYDGSDNRHVIIAESGIASDLRNSFREAGLAQFSNPLVADQYFWNISASGPAFLHRAIDHVLTFMNRYPHAFHYRPCVMYLVVSNAYSKPGDTEQQTILNKLKGENQTPCAIYSVALGAIDHMDFLEKLSAQNFGFARAIPKASGADTQLVSLFTEVFDVVVRKMRVEYADDTVNQTTLTDTVFPVVVNRTESLVCGRLLHDLDAFQFDITGEMTADQDKTSLLFEAPNATVNGPTSEFPTPTLVPRKICDLLTRANN